MKSSAGEPTDNLRVDRVTVDFHGLRAVNEASLQVARGEILGLIGPNGAGKTTLVNVMSGFQSVSAGTVALDGRDVTHWPSWRRARAGLARTFQNVLLFPQLSVVENVESGALAMGGHRGEARRRAIDTLRRLDLDHLADRDASSLPFGAERRIGIGRAVVMRPSFLLMDEPAAGLNDAECADLATLIRRIRDELGCGIVLIEHRMSLVFELCGRIQVLDQGATLAVGGPQEIRADARVRRAYLGETAS
ncbi:MAG TPA: ABC transporter ATP-binding protein [Steroidobacteraceae bacterium]|nr:ABC transporter ATP-binding protein [Steroidobacteraceae bacterium]